MQDNYKIKQEPFHAGDAITTSTRDQHEKRELMAQEKSHQQTTKMHGSTTIDIIILLAPYYPLHNRVLKVQIISKIES